ncbi:MAG TPA: phosphoribosyltransferase family protein [Anaerolineales bacterium]
MNVPNAVLDVVTRRERAELERRERAYRGDRPPLDVRGKTVILVDDGLATGSSMRAVVAGLRAQQPAQIVVAVPTAAPETCEAFENEVDDVVCAVTPQPFFSVGTWYEDFSQTSDEEVRRLLEEASQLFAKILLHRDSH